MDVKVGLQRKLSTEELMLLNCGVGRRCLRVHWIARRSSQSILKEIRPEYSLEGLMLKLKFQYFGHLMWRTDSSEKTLMLGKIEGGRRRGWQRMRWLDGITDLMGISLCKGVDNGQGSLACLSPWGCKESDMTEWPNWLKWRPLSKVEQTTDQSTYTTKHTKITTNCWTTIHKKDWSLPKKKKKIFYIQRYKEETRGALAT